MTGKGDTLHSIGQCNGVYEYSGWGFVAKGLSWPCIEFPCDGIEFGLGDVREPGAFGEILAQEAVGVFIAAALREREPSRRRRACLC
jgi:hypothetical protein